MRMLEMFMSSCVKMMQKNRNKYFTKLQIFIYEKFKF